MMITKITMAKKKLPLAIFPAGSVESDSALIYSEMALPSEAENQVRLLHFHNRMFTLLAQLISSFSNFTHSVQRPNVLKFIYLFLWPHCAGCGILVPR